MTKLIGILTLSALVAATVGCQGRSPGSAKPTLNEEQAEAKLKEFNQTNIHEYPAGSSSNNQSESQSHIKFLKKYINDGQAILKTARKRNMKLDYKQTVKNNIETAKALLKSHEEYLAKMQTEPT